MLTEQNCVFSRNQYGFLQARIDGVSAGRVQIVCTQPLTAPYDYLSVIGTDGQERGMIRSPEDFSEEQRKLITEDIKARYFCPEITEILSIKDKMGSFYFDVLIGNTKKNFTVRDLTKNIRQNGKTVLITDTDGNRYKIEDTDRVDRKSRRKLEPYLY